MAYIIRVLSFFVFLILFSSDGFTEDEIRLASGEWSPLMSEKLPHEGYATHIVSEAFAAVGVKVTYGYFPWTRSMEYAKDGLWDGIFGYSRTPEREKSFYYSDIIYSQIEYLYHLKTFPLNWKKIEDLRGLRIGGTVSSVYPLLDAAEKKGILRIDRAKDHTANFKRLLRGWVDAVPVTNIMVSYSLGQLSPEEREKITRSDTPTDHVDYHLLLSKAVKGNKRFLTLFNQGYKRIKENGVYDQISKNLENGLYNKKE